MLENIFSISILLNLGALLYFIGFLVRDELILRMLVFAGTILYLTYYLLFPSGPLWNAFVTSSVLGLANLWVLAKIVFERTTLALSENEKRLYECFNTLTPGQFRILMKHAKWHFVEAKTKLCIQDQMADQFFYILDGIVTIEKNDKIFQLEHNSFLGEVAFILNGQYSATAYADQGACIIEWNNQDVKQEMRKKPALFNAFSALFNMDLALKVSSSYK